MKGECKLCHKQANLELSHFIPKFVGKWVKKTSMTGFIRESNTLDKRSQDTAKEYWLCGDCEDLFSKWETKFANVIFYPFVEKGASCANYDQWMSKFCASVSWRTLTFTRSKNTSEDKSEEYNRSIDAAEAHLSSYLLGSVENLNQYEQHVFHLDKIESTTENALPSNINRYFLRTMAMDIIGNSEDLYIYTKLPSFLILGIVKSRELNKMRSSRIAIKSGKISPRSTWWPEGFINYIVDKAKASSDAHGRIPEHHREKFEEYIRNNPDRAANSKLFEALLLDYERFGDDIFR